MKTNLKILISLCCFLGAATLKLHSQGYIVPNGVANNLPVEIDLSWPQETQINGFSLNPAGEQQPTIYDNVFAFNEPVTIGVRVFLVSPNDAISLQAIMAQSYTELSFPNSYVFQAGVPFYLGLYSGAEVAPPYPPQEPYNYLDPVFGWAELENVSGAIQLLNGELEYGGDGIYAGTQNIIQPVPEPNSFCWFAFGGLFVALCHWRKSLRQRPPPKPEAFQR
jgi:hypothetical protein